MNSNILVTDLSGVSKINPATEAEKQFLGLYRLNAITFESTGLWPVYWPREAESYLQHMAEVPISIPALTYIERKLWFTYLPKSQTLDELVFDLWRMRRGTEYLPSVVIEQYERALKLGIFVNLQFHSSKDSSEMLLVGKRHSSDTKAISWTDPSHHFILAQWDKDGGPPVTLDQIKVQLRNRFERNLLDGSPCDNGALEACATHDDLTASFV